MTGNIPHLSSLHAYTANDILTPCPGPYSIPGLSTNTHGEIQRDRSLQHDYHGGSRSTTSGELLLKLVV